MLFLPEVEFAYLYPKPIPMNWGDRKLAKICKTEMGIDPSKGDVFLFYNSKLDQLRLFFLDATGSQMMTKLLPNGGFIVPVPSKGEKFVRIEGSKLQKLFR